MAIKPLDDHCVEFTGDLSTAEIARIVQNKSVTTVQTAHSAPRSTWQKINQALIARRPDILLRIYGHYGSICDLSFVSDLKHVQRFAADRLEAAIGVDHVGDMPHLTELTIEIESLRSFDFLKRIPVNMSVLSLGRTRSKKPSLSLLERFSSLDRLNINGQHKEIETINAMTTLRYLTLRSVTTSNLSYLTELDRLQSLEIKLGGITDLDALSGLSSIRYLEIWQVRGLSQLDVVSELTGLQFIFLQSLPKVAYLPALVNCHHLRRIYLEKMKGLSSLSSLEHAPALEQFLLVDGQNFKPEDLIPVLKNKRLKQVLAGFGSDRKNTLFRQLAEQYDIDPYTNTPFQFRSEKI